MLLWIVELVQLLGTPLGADDTSRLGRSLGVEKGLSLGRSDGLKLGESLGAKLGKSDRVDRRPSLTPGKVSPVETRSKSETATVVLFPGEWGLSFAPASIRDSGTCCSGLSSVKLNKKDADGLSKLRTFADNLTGMFHFTHPSPMHRRTAIVNATSTDPMHIKHVEYFRCLIKT